MSFVELLNTIKFHWIRENYIPYMLFKTLINHVITQSLGAQIKGVGGHARLNLIINGPLEWIWKGQKIYGAFNPSPIGLASISIWPTH